MPTATFTCPRCFHTGSISRALKFCPRCGLEDVQASAADTEPVEIAVGRNSYQVLDRIAIGSISSVYRCRFMEGARQVEGVFKIARDPCANALIANEADILRRLHVLDPAGKFTPFLPVLAASVGVGDGGSSPPRQGNVLRMHDEIHSPDELYSLLDVRSQYSAGLDPRHVAWIWRRLLNILGFIHSHGFVHGAVLPMHVLIDPRDHKLLLVDWCCAVQRTGDRSSLRIIAGGFQAWYKRERAAMQPPSAALDVALGARCMIDLLGGDPVRGEFPPTVDPALQRHYRRCLQTGATSQADAWKLLADFDHLIDALWGPRTFHTLEMRRKQPGA
jgi:serine/threonine protein kinase